jgi:hypothetical protein
MTKTREEYPAILVTTGTQSSKKLSDLFAGGSQDKRWDSDREGGEIPPHYILTRLLKYFHVVKAFLTESESSNLFAFSSDLSII